MRSAPRHAGTAPVAVLFLTMLASACGGSAASSPGSSTPYATTPPAPSGSAATGEVATLANAARGTTTDVRVAAVVQVTLTSDPGYTFSAPSSSDQSVLRTTASSQTAAGALAEFRALRPGTAMISAVENPTCLPLCGLPSRLWGATVVVTPHPVP